MYSSDHELLNSASARNLCIQVFPSAVAMSLGTSIVRTSFMISSSPKPSIAQTAPTLAGKIQIPGLLCVFACSTILVRTYAQNTASSSALCG